VNVVLQSFGGQVIVNDFTLLLQVLLAIVLSPCFVMLTLISPVLVEVLLVVELLLSLLSATVRAFHIPHCVGIVLHVSVLLLLAFVLPVHLDRPLLAVFTLDGPFALACLHQTHFVVGHRLVEGLLAIIHLVPQLLVLGLSLLLALELLQPHQVSVAQNLECVVAESRGARGHAGLARRRLQQVLHFEADGAVRPGCYGRSELEGFSEGRVQIKLLLLRLSGTYLVAAVV
jgi:hypothetical protein